MTSANPQEQNDWTLASDIRGIRVYVRNQPGSRLKAFRAVMRMELADEYALVALSNDYPNLPDWIHFIRHVEELQREGPLRRWLRFITRLPWPLHDRDVVLRLDVEQHRDEHDDGVRVRFHNVDDLLPRDSGYLTVPELHGISGFRRLPGHEIELFYELSLDPGGRIPAWLANRVLRDAPFFTLERLRQVLHRPEYQGRYFDYLDLNGPGRREHAATRDDAGSSSSREP